MPAAWAGIDRNFVLTRPDTTVHDLLRDGEVLGIQIQGRVEPGRLGKLARYSLNTVECRQTCQVVRIVDSGESLIRLNPDRYALNSSEYN